MIVLAAGRWAAGADPQLLELAAPRCEAGAWCSPGGASPRIELVRGAGARPAGAVPLDAREPEAGGYRFVERTLEVWIPPSARAADAALRLLFAAAFELQGGVLVHAAGISLGGRALLAAGASGAGKSTLAQCCAGAGLGLEVLSDETIGVLPDGTLWATPFRSSARYSVAAPREPRALRALAFLEHAPEERLVALTAADATARLLRQIYPGPAQGPGERLRRAAALAKLVPPAAFRLRRHPEVAAFVRELLGGGR